MSKIYYVYIMTNKLRGVLYIGITSNIEQRNIQHKKGIYRNAFTRKYNIHKLVYCEVYSDVEDAIRREKQLKNWKRAWKIDLVEAINPEWDDLGE